MKRYCYAFLLLMALPLLSMAQSEGLSTGDLELEILQGQPIVHKYEGKRFTGVARDYYAKEDISLEYHIEDGYLTRLLGWKNNCLKERDFQYRKGVLHGKVAGYYDNGQKYFEERYVDGALHGAQYGWYSDGSLRFTAEFVNGIQIMHLEFPRPDGVLELPKFNLPGC